MILIHLSHLLTGRIGIITTVLALVLFGAASTAADISYLYDDAGRLLAVIDPASDTAIYAYDSVGNLTGITRQLWGQVLFIAMCHFVWYMHWSWRALCDCNLTERSTM